MHFFLCDDEYVRKCVDTISLLLCVERQHFADSVKYRIFISNSCLLAVGQYLFLFFRFQQNITRIPCMFFVDNREKKKLLFCFNINI